MRCLLLTLFLLALFSCKHPPDRNVEVLVDSAWANFMKDEDRMNAYLDSVEQTGQTPKDYLKLRGLAVRKANPALGIQYFNKLIEIYPDETVGFVYRGQTYMTLREWQKAEDDYTMAISRNFSAERGLTECHFNRGVAREQLQKTDAAREDFERAIEINPKDAMSYCKLGDLAASENDFVKACQLWKKSRALGFKTPAKYLKQYCE